MSNFWEKPRWEDSDPHLQSLKQMPFERALPEVPVDEGVYFIRGPRQIGKSSFLKKILHHYTEIDPSKVGFLYCDEIETFKDLRIAVDRFQGRSILILDEISFVKEWWRTIKALADQKTFKLMIITGSNTWDLKQGADLMPGRWGKGKEIEILPMDFFEFSKAYSDAKFEPVSREELLRKFFWTGGFPIALAETGGTFKKPMQTIQTIKKWLLGDAVKLGKSEKYLRDLLLQIAITQQSSLSLQKLSQRSMLGSHHTAISYVELLESTFCIKTLYAYDESKKVFHYKKDKKFYFRDPIYFQLALEWSDAELPKNFEQSAAELTAFEYLHRQHSRLAMIQTQKGEIDFIVPDKKIVEVKWGSSTQVSTAFKNNTLQDKTIWGPHNFFL